MEFGAGSMELDFDGKEGNIWIGGRQIELLRQVDALLDTMEMKIASAALGESLNVFPQTRGRQLKQRTTWLMYKRWKNYRKRYP
mmetsp:Transcript_3351/g.7035  ORF Transcript_3351/g.7035 Transcript_3351/m.7035 type:complete len:84 (+) Transcript_3351:448-699(+)